MTTDTTMFISENTHSPIFNFYHILMPTNDPIKYHRTVKKIKSHKVTNIIQLVLEAVNLYKDTMLDLMITTMSKQ